jgi:hypothetical protein
MAEASSIVKCDDIAINLYLHVAAAKVLRSRRRADTWCVVITGHAHLLGVQLV